MSDRRNVITADLQIPSRPSQRGEPAWEMLEVLPAQGEWSEAEYLALETNRLVEFTDGMIEVLPMPTVLHQLMAVWLCNLLNGLKVGDKRAGLAIVAPLKLKVRSKKYREPDVLFMKRENAARIKNELWDYADLVIEIVSEGGEARDYDDKVLAYAEAQVPEYWIVDPFTRRITQNVLDGAAYRRAGVFEGAAIVKSQAVAGFEVMVRELFEQAERELRMQDD
jgi:Uma2 family endonuclease